MIGNAPSKYAYYNKGFSMIAPKHAQNRGIFYQMENNDIFNLVEVRFHHFYIFTSKYICFILFT